STLSYLNFTLNEDGKQKKYTGQKNYLTDVLRGKAVDFIGSTPRDTPLFLYLPLKAPHSPATPAKRDRNAYRGVAVERTPSLNEEDVSDKPAYIRNAPKIDLGLLDRDEQRRLASLRSAYAAINAVLQQLRTEGRLDNTYIFVFSDNGWMRGEHRMLTKGFPYDSSVRIPMVVSGPGIAAGETDHRIVANVDVAPTIAALAKIPLPRADGKNLLSDLDREYMLMESWGGPTWSALRGKTWLYVENDSDEREYYDYETDEYELENQLANWGDHTPALDNETAARLEARLSEAKRCKGAQCP
ncbi:MAG: sulfatase-like hydrolase/transferase, partial [Thermomicrobiales bacterium]|nr:sulfatase-like hydrolase/transferase [Thermomicrobiales bacterium]